MCVLDLYSKPCLLISYKVFPAVLLENTHEMNLSFENQAKFWAAPKAVELFLGHNQQVEDVEEDEPVWESQPFDNLMDYRDFVRLTNIHFFGICYSY